METKAPTDFTRLRRMHERGHYDRDSVNAILDAANHCHVGHIINDRPVVIPTLHWRDGDEVFWHGSSASRMVRANGAGGEVCLTATIMDGYVLARSGYNHSINYRSVMCFGIPRLVNDPQEKMAALKIFVERLFPGRWDGLRPPNDYEIKATSVLAMKLTEASAKVRSAPPGDNPEDTSWPIWAGVLPVATIAGAPEPDQFVTPGLTPPSTPQVVG